MHTYLALAYHMSVGIQACVAVIKSTNSSQPNRNGTQGLEVSVCIALEGPNARFARKMFPFVSEGSYF